MAKTIPGTTSASPPTPPLPATAAPPAGRGVIQLGTVTRAGQEPVQLEPEELEGYEELELLISGKANDYRYGETTDDLLVAEPDQPYTSRIVVHRPIDPTAFNGTVILEIAHPEIGLGPLWRATGSYLRAHGDAHVMVTTRRNTQAYGERTPVSILKAFDPERYAPVDFQEGGLSWDIIAQTAALLRSESPYNPLAGYGVSQIVGGGYSGAGAYALMFLRSFHDHWRRPDGGPLVDAWFVGEPSWYQQISTLDDRIPADQIVPDIDAPVISLYTGPQEWMDLATGLDVDRIRPDRDGERRGYRTFELAGGGHANMPGCGLPASDNRLDHIFRLCVDYLKRWAAGEGAPPHGERITLADPQEGRTSRRAVRDEHGNATGGLRTTWLDVPHARYTVCRETNTGVMEPFPPARMEELYGDQASYVRLVEQRGRQLVAEGWLLAADLPEVVAAAQAHEPFGDR